MSHGLFVCAVCLENMRGKKPRGLICFHSLCEPCIKGIIDNSHSSIIHCPSCRVKTQVPSGDVTKLPLNFYLDALHDTPPTQGTDICICTICKNDNKYTEAVARCEDCSVYLCLVCRNVHINHPVLSKHKLTSLKHEANDMCLVHRKPLKYICSKCNYDICAECIHSKVHLDHPEEIINIKERLEEDSQSIKTEIETSLKMLEHKKSYLDHVISSLTYAEEAVKSRVTLVTEEVKHAASSIQNELQRQRNTVKDTCKNIEEIKSSTKKAEAEYTRCQSAYGQQSYTELMHAKLSVENKIKEAKDICLKGVANVKFVPVENKHGGLGRIITMKEDMIDIFSYQVDSRFISDKDNDAKPVVERGNTSRMNRSKSLDDLNEEDNFEAKEASLTLHASFTPPTRQHRNVQNQSYRKGLSHISGRQNNTEC